MHAESKIAGGKSCSRYAASVSAWCSCLWHFFFQQSFLLRWEYVLPQLANNRHGCGGTESWACAEQTCWEPEQGGVLGRTASKRISCEASSLLLPWPPWSPLCRCIALISAIKLQSSLNGKLRTANRALLWSLALVLGAISCTIYVATEFGPVPAWPPAPPKMVFGRSKNQVSKHCGYAQSLGVSWDHSGKVTKTKSSSPVV